MRARRPCRRWRATALLVLISYAPTLRGIRLLHGASPSTWPSTSPSGSPTSWRCSSCSASARMRCRSQVHAHRRAPSAPVPEPARLPAARGSGSRVRALPHRRVGHPGDRDRERAARHVPGRSRGALDGCAKAHHRVPCARPARRTRTRNRGARARPGRRHDARCRRRDLRRRAPARGGVARSRRSRSHRRVDARTEGRGQRAHETPRSRIAAA